MLSATLTAARAERRALTVSTWRFSAAKCNSVRPQCSGPKQHIAPECSSNKHGSFKDLQKSLGQGWPQHCLFFEGGSRAWRPYPYTCWLMKSVEQNTYRFIPKSSLKHEGKEDFVSLNAPSQIRWVPRQVPPSSCAAIVIGGVHRTGMINKDLLEVCDMSQLGKLDDLWTSFRSISAEK